MIPPLNLYRLYLNIFIVLSSTNQRFSLLDQQFIAIRSIAVYQARKLFAFIGFRFNFSQWIGFGSNAEIFVVYMSVDLGRIQIVMAKNFL